MDHVSQKAHLLTLSKLSTIVETARLLTAHVLLHLSGHCLGLRLTVYILSLERILLLECCTD